MKKSQNLFKRLSLLAAALCVGCCAFPIGGVLVGVSSLSALSKYLEWTGIVALALALTSFGVYYKKKSALVCDINCDCGSELDTSENHKADVD